MRHRILLPGVVTLALAFAGVATNCGGDDTTGTTGPTGTAGSSTGGKGGSGGSATGGNAGSGGRGGTAGSGGTAGNGGKGGSGGATGGMGGTAGSGGAGGQRDAGDASTPDTSTSDVRTDTPPSDAPIADAAPDVRSDRPDGSVAFSAVTAIFQRCTPCHRPRETGAQLLDLATSDGLYARLTSPLPDNQEGKCGFPDGGADAAADGGDAATPPNRQAIVPGDTGASLLFLKVAGTQPTGCGVRMPRVSQFGEDGGALPSVGCDQADGGAASNCLSQADLDTIRDWITQGASPN